MRTFFDYFVRHPTAANLLMAAALIAGLWAALEIRRQFFPDIVVERATVRVAWPGAGPAEVDDGVVALLEPPIRAVDGVSETRTIAREGSASIAVEFEPGVDLTQAMNALEAAVDGAAALPDGAEDPVVTRSVFRDRVTNVVISGDAPLTLLAGYAEELRGALFQAGVTRVSVTGVAGPDLRVEPSDAALRRYGLTFQDIAAAIRAEVVSRPAGALSDQGSRVRAGKDRRTVASLAEIPLIARADGSRVLLGDVAEIRDASGGVLGPDDGVALFAGGRPAVELSVERNAEGDGVAIQDTVRRAVDRISPSLPAGVEMRLTRTRAQAITDRLDLLVRNGGAGLLIVLGLLFLFLSARTALWVAAGIPTAMLGTILIMYAAGLSLNMLSLFALIICLGIVVDDAIVVGEHADRLARDGLSPADAASAAAARMAAPVFSASITTVIAFSALVVIGGRFGDLIQVLPITVGVVLIASLIECFVILPAHMKHALAAQNRPRGRAPWYDAPSRVVNRGFDWFRRAAFAPAVSVAMRLRYVVVFGAVGLLLSSLALQTSGTVRWFFIQFPERGTIQANIAMLPGATRADTFAMLEEMRRALDVTNAAFADDHGSAPVVDSLARLGSGTGRGLAGSQSTDPDRLGGFEIELIDPDLRSYSSFDFIRAWRAEIQRPPLLETLALRGDRSGPGGDAIEVEIFGDLPPETLKSAAEDLKAALSRLEGVSALEDSLPYDRPEFVLSLTPKGAALGYTTESVSSEVAARLDGVEAATFPVRDLEGVITVQAPAQERIAGLLPTIEIAAPGGARAALADVVSITEAPSFASVLRLDGRVVVTVNGEIIEDAATREAVRAALETEILPQIAAVYGVETRQGGLTEQERSFLSDALVGFLLCLLGMYLVLAWVLASWSRPLVILLAIPFGYIGAVWGHYWHGVALSMFSVVGLIGMSGIIINDSIVLMTAIDEKARRRPIFEAVVAGVADRLRAVLLTTLTTVGGLAPLLFETSRQALFLKPTVITLAYGLGFGMVIVLLVTPAMMLITHDIANRLGALRRLLAWLVSSRRRRLAGGA